MEVVDAQVHVWAADRPGRRWPDWGKPHLPTPLDAEAVLERMRQADVARAVLVPPSWEGDRNDVALAAARDWPEAFAVMGRVDLMRPDRAAAIARWRERPGMLGARLTFTRPQLRALLLGRELEDFWAAAEGARVPIMVYAPGLARELGHVAAMFPGLRLIVDHLGLPRGTTAPRLLSELSPLLALARHANVAAKCSALPCYVNEPPPFPTAQAALRITLAAFGAERVLWGSDLSRLPYPLETWVGAVGAALSDDDREWIMGRSARVWLDWT